jgi:hypothetical protein
VSFLASLRAGMFNFYGRNGKPCGPPTSKERNRFGIEEAWLRWSFFFGDGPVDRRSRLAERTHRSPSYPSVPEVGLCMVLPRKGHSALPKGGSSSGALVKGPFEQLPELWAFLTSSAHPDGAKRKTGSLSFKFDGGQLTLSLNDHETKQFCSLSGTSVLDLLETAELRMVADELAWRPSKY